MKLNLSHLYDGKMIHRVRGISITAQLVPSHYCGYECTLLIARVGWPVKSIIFNIGNNDYLSYHYAKEKLPNLSEREIAEFMILTREWCGMKIGSSPAFNLDSDPENLEIIEEFWQQ